MSNSIAQQSQNAKSGAGKSFTGNAKSFPTLLRVASAINALWPKKTAQYVAHLTNCDERTVKFWLAGETRMSVEAVGRLLDTDEGFEILTAIMGDSKRAWWQAMQIAQQLRTSKANLKREEKRTAALRAQLSLIEEDAQ